MAIRCLNEAHGESFAAYHGDCVDVLAQLPADSIDFSVYSPPFGSLFVYSESAADMGNSTDEQFANHYAYLVREKFRVTKPGRITAVHCSDLPMTKWKDGAVGIKDFSGDIIRIHQDAGWIMHSRRTIWKCPVVEMTRTKHVGLLYKQLVKDSSKSRGGMPDYLITFVKPGQNGEAIAHRPNDFPVEQWQEWASPVWMTVDQSNVLNVKMAREQSDERHLCPLQLDVVDRALILWSNPGNTVLSPFMGIGSEGVRSLAMARKFIGVELAAKYFKPAVRYLEAQDRQDDLFAREMAESEAA
jgi:DNA modification methylase